MKPLPVTFSPGYASSRMTLRVQKRPGIGPPLHYGPIGFMPPLSVITGHASAGR